MTVKDLRTTTAPYNNIIIKYGNSSVEIAAEDTITLEAFGSFVIDTVSIENEENISATLKMQPIKE